MTTLCTLGLQILTLLKTYVNFENFSVKGFLAQNGLCLFQCSFALPTTVMKVGLHDLEEKQGICDVYIYEKVKLVQRTNGGEL